MEHEFTVLTLVILGVWLGVPILCCWMEWRNR